MKKYKVTIRATVTKVIEAKASSPEKAQEIAHDSFCVSYTGPEKYTEEVIDVELVKKKSK